MLERLLREVVSIDPQAGAVERGGVWWSWGDLSTLIAAIDERLNALKAPAGARIGIILRSNVPQLAAAIECVISGRCIVAFNPLNPAGRLADDIASQQPAVLVASLNDLVAPEISSAAEALKIPVIQVPEEPGEGIQWGSEVRSIAPGSLDRLAPDILVEMLTSGTTGTPKRVSLNRKSFDAGFESAQAYERGGGTDVAKLRSGIRIVSAPLTVIGGLYGALSTCAQGRQLVLLEKFTVEGWVSVVERHKARVANLPPAAIRMLLDADIPKERLSTILALRSGSAPLDPATIDSFLERYDIPVLAQYGATEFVGAIAGWSLEDFRAHYAAKRGSVGRIQAGIQARVVHPESGVPLGTKQEGILELKGQQINSTDSWTRTTDRASLDEDGFLWIHGRADSAINRGGFKVHPEDIVRAIQEHPAVREAVVIGVPDQRLGEIPSAAIMLVAGAEAPTMEEFRRFLATRLISYQVPAKIKFVDDVPRTPSMKPNLAGVRQLFVDTAE